MIQLKDIDRELAEILLDNVINNQWKPTYTEVATDLSNRLGREINPHYGLRNPLGVVSTLCFDLGLPLISARVIYSGNTSNQAVGEGFYPFACEFRPEYRNMTPVDAWKNEIKLIRNCTNWNRLREYLDGIPVAKILSREQLQSKLDDLIEEDSDTDRSAPTPRHNATEPVFPDELNNYSSQPEGGVKTVQVSVHERNSSLRRQCLEYYGTTCAVCDVDLGSVYGEEFTGRIHVHHLNPLSEFEEEHEVDPILDLRPVCPNCHMIIHCRREKPYSIDEVKGMLGRK